MNSEQIGIEDARARLGELVAAAQEGADIVLTRRGRPAARLIAYKEPVMTYLATVTETTDSDGIPSGGSIGVDECRDGAVIASPWTRDLIGTEAEGREWNAILADAGWKVAGGWDDHDGYWTAEVEPAPVRTYAAAIATASDVVEGDCCDVSVIETEPVTYRTDGEGNEVPEYGLTDRIAMDAVETDVRTDDEDKLTKAIAAGDEILRARGWRRVGAWEPADNALYATVERA